jgi:hypothetical protein
MPYLGDAAFSENGRVEHEAGTFYEPAPGDVIWSPKDAGIAWGLHPDTVVKRCLQGRVKHIKVAQEIIILQREKPEPMAPGTLTDEQREAIGRPASKRRR